MVSFSVISTVNRLAVRQAHETFLVANVSGLDVGINPYSVEWVPRPVSPGESGGGVKLNVHSHLLPKYTT